MDIEREWGSFPSWRIAACEDRWHDDNRKDSGIDTATI